MSGSDRVLRAGFAALAFALPLALYLGTASGSVQFDDAAELTLCARFWSSAHPPGYPIWVLLAHLWGGVFGYSPRSLAALSGVLGAAASLVLFFAGEKWLRAPACGALAPRAAAWAALGAALLTAVGATCWQWSNSVEVYALQVLATALLLWGAAGDQARWCWRAVLGLGVGLGLANNHLSMVVLLPFVPNWVAALQQRPWGSALRALLPAALLAAALTACAWLLLLLRAMVEVPFSFGEPSTPSRLWFHLRGGFFGELLFAPGVDYAGRAMVFGEVLLRHLWLAWIPFVLGARHLWSRQRGLLVSLVAAAGLLFASQWARAYVPNMDASVLPALLLLAPVLALGLTRVPRVPFAALLPALLAASLVLDWSACDRRGYAAADAILADVDASLPPNALLLATGWELQTRAALAQLAEQWRPDVVVLPGSVKGTDAPLFARRQPELHAAVREEYDAFLAAIAAVDPDYVHTDYFQFEDPAVWQRYAALLGKLFAVAKAQGRPVLLDKQSMAFLLDGKVLRNDQVVPCGLLFSIGEVAAPAPFPLHDGWLGHPFLTADLCAYGTLFDLQGIAPQIAGYWRHRGRTELAAAAERAAERLAAAWREYSAGVPAPRRR